MEQAALVVGILCPILSVVLAFLHDWKVIVVRRDGERARDDSEVDKK